MPNSNRKAAVSRLEDARSRMYRDLIFESAEHVFGEKGFESSTMQEVASEAGVSLKTVYAIYPGKRDLYDAIMLERGREMFEAVALAHRGATDPLDKLIAGTRAFVGFLFSHPAWSGIHIRSQASWALRPEEAGAAALWDEGQRAHERMLSEGIEAGIFFEDDPAEMALMVRAMTRVQVVNAIANGEKGVEAIADRLVVRLQRMIVKDPQRLREVG